MIKKLIADGLAMVGSRKKLCDNLGVSRQSLFRWEKEELEPNAEHLWKLLCLIYKDDYITIGPAFNSYIRNKFYGEFQ